MPNLVGYTLGKYQLVDRLGRGGMADVYKAYQPGLDRYVAIKVLHPHLAEQPDFVARFKREAQSVSGLHHPNIVQVFDFDIQDDNYYMAMAYIDGGRTLKEVLRECNRAGQRLPIEQSLDLTAKVANALEYAHQQGMIHRDVKPANILIQSLDRPILGDFGIAHIVDMTTLTRNGTMVGTPAYMSPEQATGGKVTARSDIYALGVTLYEMLTGKPPYDADTPYGVILKHISDPLVPPHLVVPLPQDIESVVLKSLAKRPDQRFASAEEMAAALQRVSESIKNNGGFVPEYDAVFSNTDSLPGDLAHQSEDASVVSTNILDANPEVFGNPHVASTVHSAAIPADRTYNHVPGHTSRAGLSILGLLAVGVVLLVAALAWLLGANRVIGSIPPAPPGSIFAADIVGPVELSLPGQPVRVLKTGDTVKVGSGDPSAALTVPQDGRAVISLDDGSVLYVGPATTVNLDQLVDSSQGATDTLLTIQMGTLLARVASPPSGSFTIKTPIGTRADVSGSLMGVRYTQALQQFDVDCLEGSCRVFGGPGIAPLALTACQHSVVVSIGAPEGPDQVNSDGWRGLFGDAAPQCPTATPDPPPSGLETSIPTRVPLVTTPTPSLSPTGSPAPSNTPAATASAAPVIVLPTSTVALPGATDLPPVETLLPTIEGVVPTVENIVPTAVPLPPVVPTVPPLLP